MPTTTTCGRTNSFSMNIILLRELDWVAQTTVVLRDYRAKHLLSILKVTPGQTVRVGLINGKVA